MISDFLRHVAWVLREKTSFPKTSLLLTYSRITLKYAVLVRLLRRPLTKDRIFGRTVRFYDYEAFKLLFEDIFITEEYRFQPATAAPRIIDCGGNIGFAVLYFKMLYPEARITSFEASPQSFELMQQNVRDNGLRDVELLNCAVWDRDGEVQFYFDPKRPGDLGGSTQREKERPGATTVRSVRLSSYLTGPVDLVKMDIEGSEDAVIDEVAQAGQLRKINELVMEYHHHIQVDCDRLAGVLRALEENGFGYQLSTFCRLVKHTYQQMMLYAYRK